MEARLNLHSPEDLDHLIASRGAEEAIPALAQAYWNRPSELVRTVQGARCLRVTRSSVHTVAIFFHALGVGGGERVTRDLALTWHRMGLNVVVLTNTEPAEGDYELPHDITRVTIPSFVDDLKNDYVRRCTALRETLTKYNVDLIVFAQWFSDVVAFDILSVKTLGIPFLFYIQTSFTQFFLDADFPSRYVDIPLQYSITDGIICLSDMDRLFWSSFNNNTVCTQNPVSTAPTGIPAPLSGHAIIWPARLHVDKYPLRVIPIMEALLKKVPDAVLWMVGPTDPLLAHQLMEEARSRNLDQSIILCGPQNEEQMPSWYQKADAFLLVSKREGWPLALGEALATGLPCVMYDLPYLALSHDNSAVISVTQNDAEAAADALAAVLLDKEKARRMGEYGRSFMKRIATYDYEGFWSSIFATVTSTQCDDAIDSQGGEENASFALDDEGEEISCWQSIMWKELLEAYRAHLEVIEGEQRKAEALRCQSEVQCETIASLKEALHEMRAELDHVLSSKSFKIGIIITQTPRRLFNLFRKTS